MERARRMTCVYSAGFGRVEDGEYPIMSTSGLVSTAAAPHPAESLVGDSSMHADATSTFKSLENFAFDGTNAADLSDGSSLYRETEGKREFLHSLVQEDEHGRPYVLCHGLCLDHLEEAGRGALSWQDSVAFVEALLGRGAKPPHLLPLEWRRGDLVIWDNRTTQHSVTPSHGHGGVVGYAAKGLTRLMTRTAMQPSWVPSVRDESMADSDGHKRTSNSLSPKEKADVVVIAISGASRSGKSTLTVSLSECIGSPRCVTLHQDSYWHRQVRRVVDGESILSDEETSCTNWASFNADFLRLMGVQKQRAQGEGRPCYIIVEGFSILHSDAVAQHCSHAFHIQLGRQATIDRRCQPHSDDRPNPYPKTRKYCERVLWPAHLEYVERSVRHHKGIVYLEGGDFAARDAMLVTVVSVVGL